MKEIDDYAFDLYDTFWCHFFVYAADSAASAFSGIEVIACIQTLGHLGQMLQWAKYGSLRDTAEVLLAESAETYAFIEKVSRQISCISLPADCCIP